MTLPEFIGQYSGKYVDFDGYYGAQCVDLAQYWSQNLGGPRFTGNAADIFGEYPDFYNSIPNTPSAVPQPGDIVIWGSALNNGPGHIAIFVSGDAKKFTSFDQNWPLNSPCHLQDHNYNFVTGWLHPIKGDQTVTITQAEYDDLKHWKDYGMLLQNERDTSTYPTIEKQKAQIADLQAQVTGLQQQITELKGQLATGGNDTVQLNSLGLLLQWLLKRLGLK